jgi:hypothetical protein
LAWKAHKASKNINWADRFNLNLSAQFLISKLDIGSLQRVRFSIRLLVLIAFLYLVRALALRTSGFSTGPSLCIFRSLTGLPCPFCGTTRSVGNILVGDFNSALQMNPLGYVTLAFLVFLFISPSSIQHLSAYLAKKWWGLKQRTQVLIPLGILAMAWLFNLPRLI